MAGQIHGIFERDDVVLPLMKLSVLAVSGYGRRMNNVSLQTGSFLYVPKTYHPGLSVLQPSAPCLSVSYLARPARRLEHPSE